MVGCVSLNRSDLGESLMIDHLLFVYAFNLRHAGHLVEGLTPEQGVAQPGGLVNHVAWSIGHLALTSDVVAMELGQAQVFPPEWMERFFPGMPITSDVGAYPPLPELLAQLEISHARLSALIPTLSAKDLEVEPKMELVRRRYAKVGQFATYAMTAHEGVHLGQVADIRRALGLENTDL
ncbi:MAG: hypothetical protein CMJ23_09980 [Phycisphaerae bacterium]|nr:hypothetical protein [Phycisphaerae bacterium]